MKRIFAAMGVAAVLCFAGGCTMEQGSGQVPNRMNGGFTTQVTMQTADREVQGMLTRYGMQAWRVVFTEPPALDGVQLDFVDNEVTASYKGLSFSVPQSAQAVKTMLQELMEIVDGMAAEAELTGTQEAEQIVQEGEIEEGTYTLLFDKEGVPVRFELPCYGLTLTFDSFTADGSTETAEPSETTVPPTTVPTTETSGT